MKRGAPHRHVGRDRPRPRRFFLGELSADTLRSLRKDLKKQSKRYRKRLKRCQQEFSESAVHAFRVQSRRLISSIELWDYFLSADDLGKIMKAVKCNLDIFDGLRDTQVHLQTIGKMRRNFPAARDFHAFLRQHEEKCVRQARRDIQNVRTGHLKKLIAGAREHIKRRGRNCSATRASRFLLAAVDRAFAKTGHLRKQIDPRRPETIHRTRVAFKRFRYMVETLACHAPHFHERLLPEMRQYQTMMGDIQDSILLLAALDKFLRENEIHSEAATRLRDELLRRVQWLIRSYLARAGQLKEFWK